MTRVIGILGLIFACSSALATTDGFHSSVRELQLILEGDASQLRQVLGTAYPIENITSLDQARGYAVSAMNNRGQLCTVEIEAVYTKEPLKIGPPELSLKYGQKSCK
jgi:hypothetical protein